MGLFFGPVKVSVILKVQYQVVKSGLFPLFRLLEKLEDGKLKFTGKAWMNESGENRIEIYVRSQNTREYYGSFSHTVEYVSPINTT